MTTVLLVLSGVLLVLGVLVLITSTIGVLVFPDLYTRAHAVAMSETFGLLLVFGGLLLHPATGLPAGIRLVLVIGFALIANPTAVHALVRAAYLAGAEPWKVLDQQTADAELGTQPERQRRTGRPAPTTSQRRTDLEVGPDSVEWPLPYRDEVHR